MKRALRIAVWVVTMPLVIALAVLSAVILYARTDAGRERVRALVLAQARRTLPGLDIGHVGGDYVHELWLDDVAIADSQGRRAVRVERIVVRFELLALVRRTVHVRELRLVSPSVLGRPDPGGGLNLAHLTAPTAEQRPPPQDRSQPEPPSSWKLRLDHLSIEQGAADIVDADGREIAARHLRLDASARVDADTVDVVVTRLAAAGLLPGDRAVALAARLSGPRERMRVDLSVAAPGAGTLALRGTVGVASGLEYDLALHVENARPERLLASLPPGRLSLSAHARGAGVPLQPGSHADLELEVPAGRLGAVAFERATLVASSDGQRWMIPRAGVRAPGAKLTLSARGDLDRLVADLEATVDGHVRGAAAAGIKGQARLSAQLDARRSGPTRFAAHARAQGLGAGDLHLGSLELDAHGAIARGGIAPQGTLSLRAGGLRIGAGAPSIDLLTLELDGDGRHLRAHAAAAGPRVDASLDARARRTGRTIEATVERLRTTFDTRAFRQTLALQGPSTIRFRAHDRVEFAPTTVRGSGYLFTGTMTVGGSYRFGPAAAAARREAIGELAVRLQRASLAGLPPINLDAQAALEARRATARLDGKLAGAGIHADAELPVVVPRGGSPRLAARGPIALNVKTGVVRLQDLPIVRRQLARHGLTGGNLAINIALAGDVAHPTGTAALDLRDLMLRNFGTLTRDSTLKTIPGVGTVLRLEARPDSTHLGARVLLRDAGVLVVDARSQANLGAVLAGTAAPARAPFQATVDIPAFKLESLAEVADDLKGVRGTLAGRIELGGTPARPSGRGDISVTGAAVDQVALGKVLVHGEAQSGRIDVAANLPEARGGDLYAEAHLDRARGDALDARVRGKDLDLAVARPFLPGVREIGGTAQLSVDASGTLHAPVVHGSLNLTGGRLGVIGQPTFSDVAVQASLQPGRLDVGKLAARSGGGSLDGKGWVLLEHGKPSSLVFTAHADRFLIAVAGSTGARVDGELAVEAALRDAVLTGEARVPKAVVWLPGIPTGGGRDLQRIEPRPDVKFVDQAAQGAAEHKAAMAAQAAAAPATRLDLRAQAGPVFVRSKDLSLEVAADLHITTIAEGRHKGEPAVAGSAHIRRGHINISGQRFDFDHAEVNFAGDPDNDPSLDLRLTRQFPEALVVIEIRGTPKHPELHLSSDPPVYDQAQIVSLIVTGQSGGQPSAGSSFDPTATVATAVLGKLADVVAPQIGLDVLRVQNVQQTNAQGQPTGDTDTRVEVGKYVTDRIFLSYAHVFGAPENANSNEAHLEYFLTHRWVIETVFGDAGVGSIDALWTWRR
jgi:autotransporter translocation and assembly factor TamB